MNLSVFTHLLEVMISPLIGDQRQCTTTNFNMAFIVNLKPSFSGFHASNLIIFLYFDLQLKAYLSKA